MVTALLLMMSPPALAVDGMALDTGGYDDRSSMVRLALQWQWAKRWFQGRGWHLGGYRDLSAARSSSGSIWVLVIVSV